MKLCPYCPLREKVDRLIIYIYIFFLFLLTKYFINISERRKGWNEQTLMMGAGFKLIVLIPALVILAGKAITLSLLSLLITFLGLLSMNSLIH